MIMCSSKGLAVVVLADGTSPHQLWQVWRSSSAHIVGTSADELQSRMERKGCQGGPQALLILSELLFGQPR